MIYLFYYKLFEITNLYFLIFLTVLHSNNMKQLSKIQLIKTIKLNK